jgi:hypothetical protein
MSPGIRQLFGICILELGFALFVSLSFQGQGIKPTSALSCCSNRPRTARHAPEMRVRSNGAAGLKFLHRQFSASTPPTHF